MHFFYEVHMHFETSNYDGFNFAVTSQLGQNC